MNCMIEIMKIRKNKHLQKKKMSVSAYFISDLCNVHKIKRLSFTCIYHKSDRIIKKKKKTGRYDKKMSLNKEKCIV